MPTKTQAIKLLLSALSRYDLAALYNHDMEVQVNVAQDGGERIEGEFKGRKWQGWSDGLMTWKPFRIPLKANTEPEYEDSEMKFDLAAKAEAIGMTGWDWKSKVSRWVAFDFDAIVGHSDKHTKKLSNEELEKVKNAAIAVDWVTVRKSTAGKGIHLYVFLDAVPTATHTEHAALARAILGKLSALTGYDYVSKVDTCGGNMWVWARKMIGTDGLTLIKQGSVLRDIPGNWKDHVKVISGNRRKNLPQDIEKAGQVESFEELSGKQPKIPLDDDHKKLIDYLKINNALWWWDQDNHMLVTHTVWLKKAHTDMQLKGAYDTNSAGKDLNTQNCFAGATEVMTKTGPRPIRELVGWNDLLVLLPNGKQEWQKCEIKSFGQQEVSCLIFGDKTSCYVTKHHQWLTKRSGKVDHISRKATIELIPGKTELPIAKIEMNIEPDKKMYARGFTTICGYGFNPHIEEVFCAIVPTWHNFALANGVFTGNCYMYPQRRGAWSVRRFGQGVQEHDSWTQDASGWTRCYFNREADLPTASKSFGGLEDPKGGFIFREAEIAAKAAALLGVHMHLTPAYGSRETKLKNHNDGRLQVIVERKESDRTEDMQGWLPQKDKWIRLYNTQQVAKTEVEVGNHDDMIRHLVSGSEDAGWVIKSDTDWCAEPLTHVMKALASTGLKGEEVTGVLGGAVLRPWRLVNKPFQAEYPGDREWNRNAAQFRFAPSQDRDNLQYPTWAKILAHCGKGLNDAVAKNVWCKSNGILTGSDYLKCWIASMLKEPGQPLPYLFFHSKAQNTGKSSFWESISLLLTKGCQKAEAALTSQQGFNDELHGAILCAVEEIDLKNNKVAYNRIKDWVTGRELLIHPKGGTPYQTPNTTHWVQCSNDHQSCPVFGEDTRIVMIHVDKIPLADLIPRKQITVLLEKEAPDFLAEVLNLELPASNDRLNIPAIETEDKLMAASMNRNELEVFLDEYCVRKIGAKLKFSEVYNRFSEKCDPNQISRWSKIRVGKELPHHFPKGRHRSDAQFYIGNIDFANGTQIAKPGTEYVMNDGYLDLVPTP